MNYVRTLAGLFCLLACLVMPPARAAGYFTTIASITGSGDGCGVRFGNLGRVESPSELIEMNGLLYGTAPGCGDFGKGIVYSINPATGAEAVLHSFTGGADGGVPEASLAAFGGLLYGTTSVGGAVFSLGGVQQLGTIFKVKP